MEKRKGLDKAQSIAITIEKQLLCGELGKSGDKFYTVRELASIFNVSPVTAIKVFSILKEKNLIQCFGKHYFLTTGNTPPSSDLGKRLKKNASGKKIIGVHVPEIENPFFSSLVEQINVSLAKNGYLTIISTSNNDCEMEKNILDNFINIGVQGIISCSNLGDSLLKYYNSYPLPIVHLGNRFENEGESFVMVNDDLATKQVAEHLIEMGYKHFMYVGVEDQNNTDKRYTSFVNALEKNGKQIPIENVFRLSDYQQFSIPQSLLNTIKNCQKPLGIFCFHDVIAVNVITACQKLFINIPEDVGIVGFDNLRIAEQCKPTLSSIAYRFDGMASSAVKLLLEKINLPSNSNNNKLDYVNHYLTVRESSLRKK